MKTYLNACLVQGHENTFYNVGPNHDTKYFAIQRQNYYYYWLVIFVQSIQITPDYGMYWYWFVYMIFRCEYPTKIKTSIFYGFIGLLCIVGYSLKDNMDFVKIDLFSKGCSVKNINKEANIEEKRERKIVM